VSAGGPRDDRSPPPTDTGTASLADTSAATDPAAPSGRPADSTAEVILQLPGRFEVLGRLGKGGMAVVLRVNDHALGRDVAVKLLSPSLRWDPTLRARFLREARAAATLRHPALVTVFDIDPEGRFMVMELVRGESLKDRLARGALPPAEVRRIGRALCEGLAAAHAAGVIHRDVKPGNVLLGEAGEVKLADFGIASFGDSDLTTTGSHVGTPAYMPPEQLRGRTVDARADVYAAGATLFEAATGRRVHAVDASVEDPEHAVLATTQDPGLARAIAKALRDRPDERHRDAMSFAAALGARLRPRRPIRRWLAIALTGATLGGAFAIVAAALIGPGAEDGVVPAPPGSGAPSAVVTPAPLPAPAPAVALLPFADHTGDPRLDFAAAGLPHLFEMELRRLAPALPVLGYYRLLERVSSADAAPAEWLAAARALGAGVTVGGELRNGPRGVHVSVTLAGSIDATLVRDTPAEGVPEAVRALAAEAAAQLVGRAVTRAGALPRPLEIERRLHLGIAALERHELETAEVELSAVVADDPGLAEAHYWLAMARWWRGAGREEVLAEIAVALSGDLSEPQRGFLEGLRLFVDWRTGEAIAHFRALAARFPRDRDVLYGLMEALYHGGRPAEAVSVYRSMVELSPRFKLGLVHVLTYYTARTDEEGMAWALARADVVGEPPREIWAAKMNVSRGDLAGAIDLLRRVSTGSASPEIARLAELELTRVLAIDGQLDLSLALVRRLYESTPMAGILDMRALHTLRGDAREAAHWRDLARRDAAGHPAGFPRANAWIEVFLLDPPDAPAAALAELEHALDDVPEEVTRMEIWLVARAFVAGARGDARRLEAIRACDQPEAAAVAGALLAERAGDLAAAARGWESAIAAVGNGRFLQLEYHALARVRRAAGDRAGVVAACREVLRPRLYDWGWASRVASCRAWTAEAGAAGPR
jgi:tetratricopeptide (TPR) repeat protein